MNPDKSTAESEANGDDTRYIVQRQELEIDKLFRALVKLEGSDLHLKVGRPPYVRVNGTLRPMNRGPIDDPEAVRLFMPMFDAHRRKILDETGGADFAHVVDVDGEPWRFRVNILQQQGIWEWSPAALAVSFPTSPS